MSIQNKKTNNKKPILILGAIILLLGIASYTAYAATNKIWPFSANQPSQSTDKNNDINYDPPTKQELDASQDGKKNSAGESAPTTPSKNINITVSYAGLSDNKSSIEVDAYTADVIEGTGTCAATFTNGSVTVTGKSQAMVDASSSICEPILIPLSQFSTSGTWRLVTTYNSTNYSGTSEAQNVEVKI